MTSASPMANPMFAAAPHNTYPVMPGGMAQVPSYPRSQPQVQLIPVNPPVLTPSMAMQPAQKGLKEGKSLGAIQIMIGLIHTGFGSIMVILIPRFYTAISFFGGFTYWGGIWVSNMSHPAGEFPVSANILRATLSCCVACTPEKVPTKAARFITSGSLSVAAENYPRSLCLLNVSLGFNITSAVFSMIGIMLFITDLAINSAYDYSYYYIQNYWVYTTGIMISALLLVFCILEFCIVCVSCHFACQLACYRRNNAGMVFPNAYVANPAAVPEPANIPMTHSNEAQGST
ncbi:hypothetical protein MC885_000852 [Smutsia gigantea]|nr:hypothetical protein MC885_000852 [Smutsia gigantea]